MVRGGEQHLILAVRENCNPDMVSALPEHLQMTRWQALSEPRCSDARSIWATRHLAVPIGDRLRILGRLAEAECGLPLEELAGLVRSSEAEPAAVVLALVCMGQANVELRGGLSPSTILRRRTT